MPGKWNGQRCPACGEGTLHDDARVQQTEYRGVPFTSKQSGAYCDKCGDGVVYNDPATEQLWAEFRERVVTEQAAELAAIRARLNLTQEEASRLSGGGHNAFSRYERCEAQPVVGILNLFRLFDRNPSLLNEFLPGRGAVSVSTEANSYVTFSSAKYGTSTVTQQYQATLHNILLMDISDDVATDLTADVAPQLCITSASSGYQLAQTIRTVSPMQRKAARG